MPLWGSRGAEKTQVHSAGAHHESSHHKSDAPPSSQAGPQGIRRIAGLVSGLFQDILVTSAAWAKSANHIARIPSHNTKVAPLQETVVNEAIKKRLLRSASKARETVKLRNSVLKRILILPDGNFRASWDALFLCALVYTMFDVPFALVFLETECGWNWREIVNTVWDTIFFCDILLTFNTAYFDENVILIEGHHEIAAHYIRTWLMVDVVSTVPFDRVVCIAGGTADSKDYLRLFKYLRLLKMFRLFRFMRVIRKWERLIGHGFLTKALKLFQLAIFIIFCAHICGCGWILFSPKIECSDYATSEIISSPDLECACYNTACHVPLDEGGVVSGASNWLEFYDSDLARQGLMESRYLASVYFTIVSLSTVGFGDIMPVSDQERGYAIFVAMLGAAVFAVCVGSITNLATESNQSEVLIDEAARDVFDLLQFKQVPFVHQAKLRRHMAHMSLKTPHVLHHNLSLMPLDIRKDVVNAATLEEVSKVPLLGGLDLDTRAAVASFLRGCLLRPDEFLFKSMDTASEMYFVLSGEMEVWDMHGLHIIEKVRQGDIIGESAMFIDQGIPVRLTSLKARNQCEVLELTREDFLKHIKPRFPDLFKAIRSVYQERVDHINLSLAQEVLSKRSMQRCLVLDNQLRQYQKAHQELSKAAALDPHLVDKKHYKSRSGHSKYPTICTKKDRTFSGLSIDSVGSAGSRPTSEATSTPIGSNLRTHIGISGSSHAGISNPCMTSQQREDTEPTVLLVAKPGPNDPAAYPKILFSDVLSFQSEIQSRMSSIQEKLILTAKLLDRLER